MATEQEEQPNVVKEIDETTCPTEVKEEFIHMDTSEPEKLSWIGDLPPPPKPSDLKVQQIGFMAWNVCRNFLCM